MKTFWTLLFITSYCKQNSMAYSAQKFSKIKKIKDHKHE